MTQFGRLLQELAGAGVEFILVGGMAGIAHGAARVTQDLDVVYARNRENLARVAVALAPYRPYPRGAPPGLPFLWDAETLRRGGNFTLTTELGYIDLLAEITGGGRFEDLIAHTEQIELFGRACRVLRLDTLIQVKRAAGRPKDFEAIAELEALLEERKR